MATETETFTASNGTDITSVGSSIWAYGNGSSGKLFVTDNQIRAVLNETIAWFARRAGTFTDNQYAQIKLAKFASSSRIGVCVRANTTGTGYLLVASASEYLLIKRVSFSFVQLRAASLAFSVNDILSLEASGTTLTCKKNGTSFWTATDSDIASGNPGVADLSSNALDFTAGDDWEGGDLVTAALQNFQYDWPHQLHARR
jgi:hypothetical protein